MQIKTIKFVTNCKIRFLIGYRCYFNYLIVTIEPYMNYISGNVSGRVKSNTSEQDGFDVQAHVANSYYQLRLIDAL